MKTIYKTSYIIFGCALMLSSCAQEEAPTVRTDGGDRRIVFHISLPEVTTRATEVVYDLPHFYMTSFDETDIVGDTLKGFFYNKKFEKESDNKFLNETCVWPDPGKESDKLHFFAYYPAMNEGASFFNATSVNGDDKTVGYKIEEFKVAPNIADQVDFVTAYATGSMADNLFSGIQLNFNHKLSRIEVMAKSSSKSYKLEIAGVRIGGVDTLGTYNFKAVEGAGDWTLSDENENKGSVEYIYRPGDKIVALDNTTEEVSIMGGSEGNYAMLLPSSYTGWDFANDHTNSNKGMYISVLLRVLDKTPNGNDNQQYPYHDNSQGLNAMNITRVYLAVDKRGNVRDNPGKLYKGDKEGEYYTDEAKTIGYQPPFTCEVKEFGWAALPVTGNWQSGYSYTYTLDYTSGVGLHDPSVKDPQSGLDSAFPGPMAGDPIISDRVGVSVSVNDWQGLNGSTTSVEKVPGS